MATINFTLTTNGANVLAKQLGGVSGGAQILYLEVGTGALTPSASTTALTTPLSPRVATTNSVTGSALTVEGFFTNSQANGTLTECALWTAITGGTLIASAQISPSLVKSTSNVLTITGTVTLS
jgi:hypothetical protein